MWKSFISFYLLLGAVFISQAKVSENTSDYKFSFDNRITGVLLYAPSYF